MGWVAVDKAAVTKLKPGIKKLCLQNPGLEKTILRTNTPLKEKAHLPHLLIHLCFPPVSSPA